MQEISLDQKFSLLVEHWRPKAIVAFNQEVKLVKVNGECVVVPHGVEHRTCANEEAWILCFEAAETLNTGNVRDTAYTAPRGVTI